MKTIVTITGIRPDFIRMSKIFDKLDKNFKHIMIHTGQHYNDELSKIFFYDLNIRKPDYTLECGQNSKNHYEQLSYLAKELVPLVKTINPDIVLFLGDSNSAMIAPTLFKEGFRIGHIEGGMRSYDKRMMEEINRVLCDYVSDPVFVYTPLYKKRLIHENHDPKNIHVVGNTITEIIKEFMPMIKSTCKYRGGGYILADIHRNENLNIDEYTHIITYLSNLPYHIKLVKFNRALPIIRQWLEEDNKDSLLNRGISLVGPYGFIDYLKLQYEAYGIVSDSGTAQEEAALLGVPVAVPRNYTERPESIDNGNSILIGESINKNGLTVISDQLKRTREFFTNYKFKPKMIKWLGDGNTSQKIIEILTEIL